MRSSLPADDPAEAPRGFFPETLWSVVLAAGSADDARAAAALGRLCAAYRQPVFRWLRAGGWSHHEAEDATQDFFEHLLTRERLAVSGVRGARFRSYLLACLRHRLNDRHDAEHTAKRGGGIEHLEVSEVQVAAPEPAWDRSLDLEFAQTVHQHALEAVEQRWQVRGQHDRFVRLKPFVLASPVEGVYQEAGPALGLTARQVKRVVFDLREYYLDAFRLEVAQTVTLEELSDEVAHLTDFGLAKMPGRAHELTASGATLGTPAFMAPEVAAQGASQATMAADVYSLGAVLYQMITGRPPFAGESPLEVLDKVRRGHPPAPSTLQPGIPRDLEVVCLRCLRPEPGRRYASAAALADDVERFLRGEPVAARQPGKVEALAWWVRRHRLVTGFGFGLLGCRHRRADLPAATRPGPRPL